MSEDISKSLTLPEKIQIRCLPYTKFMAWFGLILMFVAALFPLSGESLIESILHAAQISCLFLYAFFMTYWVVELFTNVSEGLDLKLRKKKHKAFLLVSVPAILFYRIASYALEHLS